MSKNDRYADFAVPALLSGGLAGALLDRERKRSRATALLQTALGVLLMAALLKWASEKKRRLLLVGLGATALLGMITLMFFFRALFQSPKDHASYHACEGDSAQPK